MQTEADVRCIINVRTHNPSLKERQKTRWKLRQGVDDLLLVQPMDETGAKQLVLQMAAAQYSAIDTSEYETARLQSIISNRKP